MFNKNGSVLLDTIFNNFYPITTILFFFSNSRDIFLNFVTKTYLTNITTSLYSNHILIPTYR